MAVTGDYDPAEFDGVPLSDGGDPGVDLPQAGELREDPDASGDPQWLTIPGLTIEGDDGALLGFVWPGPATARETHMPWYCSVCACWRCTAWTAEGGGRCCWCGVFLAMP